MSGFVPRVTCRNDWRQGVPGRRPVSGLMAGSNTAANKAAYPPNSDIAKRGYQTPSDGTAEFRPCENRVMADKRGRRPDISTLLEQTLRRGEIGPEWIREQARNSAKRRFDVENFLARTGAERTAKMGESTGLGDLLTFYRLLPPPKLCEPVNSYPPV